MAKIVSVPPHSLDMEAALLGACLLTPTAIQAALDEGLTADAFYRPAHAHVFAAIVQLHERGDGVDPVTVANELAKDDLLDAVGGSAELIRLQARTPSTGNAPTYAGEIVEAHWHRNGIALLAEASALAQLDPDAALAKLHGWTPLDPVTTLSPDVATYLATDDREHDWLISDLLEWGDRLILTGGEGDGKSTLLRQLAVQVAAGVHPVTLEPMPRGNVLLVDFENGDRHLRRKLRPLVSVAGNDLEAESLRIETASGIDLLDSHARSWLSAKVAAAGPDLLIIGPLYKMAGGDPTSEEVARVVAESIDQLRSRFGVAVIPGSSQPARCQRLSGAAPVRRQPVAAVARAGTAPGPRRNPDTVAVATRRPTDPEVLPWGRMALDSRRGQGSGPHEDRRPTSRRLARRDQRGFTVQRPGQPIGRAPQFRS